MTNVLLEQRDAVAVVTLDRPGCLNALDPATRRELLSALEAVALDGGIRAVVLTGAGRGFCVGHDLGAPDDDDLHAVVRDTYNPIARVLVRMDKPVIAAINGPAVGAGMGLALSCDLRVMSEDAYLSCAFSKVGLVPDSGTSSALVRALGYARAYELAVTGRKLGATEALAAGLVNRVVPSGTLLSNATSWATDLGAGPGAAFALTKRLFLASAELGAETMLDREALSQGVASRSADYAEGCAAFHAKRPAQFPGDPISVLPPALDQGDRSPCIERGRR